MRFLNSYTASGLMMGVIGLLYYANFRAGPVYFDKFSLFSLLRIVEQPILLPRALDEWLPSFMHIIGISLFTYGVVPKGKYNAYLIPLCWMVVDVLFEVAQISEQGNIVSGGNFEWMDIAAVLFGAAISIVILSKDSSNKVSTRRPLLPHGLVVGVGVATILGSTPVSTCDFPDNVVDDCSVAPVYISKDALRNNDVIYFNSENANLTPAQIISANRQFILFDKVEDAGKIYLYGDLLFVNDKLKGTHVFDNRDVANPYHIAFIKVLGNQDIAVNNNILYLDSFTDIVAIDFTDVFNPSTEELSRYVIHRNEDMLESPDHSEYLPSRAYFGSVNPDNGVVIGYKTSDGHVFYFWDLEI